MTIIVLTDDTCNKPLLRGYIGYSVNASSVYLDYAAENVPYGTLFEDRPNHWRPELNAARAVFRVSESFGLVIMAKYVSSFISLLSILHCTWDFLHNLDYH